VVLQSRERTYLNLLQSGSVQRSKITARAAARLGREDMEDHCMHLVAVDGREISIFVDTVDTIDRVMPGGPPLTDMGRPDMKLSEEDARRINKMLLTGWKTKEDYLKGWASQGVKTGRIAQGIRDSSQRKGPKRGLALGPFV
jgi:hypothetical protein